MAAGRRRLALRSDRDADPRDAPDPHRACRRGRLPRPALQHRRRGTALCRRARRRRGRLRRDRGAAVGPRPADPRGGGARRCAPDARSGAPEGAARRRRGGHDAAPQLRRAALRPDDARRPAQGPDGRRLAAIGADHSTPACCRRSSSGCASTPALLVALAASFVAQVVLMARTVLRAEDPRRRRQSGRRPLRRHRCRRASRSAVGFLSGALAGLAGASEVAGLKGYLTADLSRGFGYAGIVVAMLAGLQPLPASRPRSSSPASSSAPTP